VSSSRGSCVRWCVHLECDYSLCPQNIVVEATDFSPGMIVVGTQVAPPAPLRPAGR
jgi:hypothetical protein